MRSNTVREYAEALLMAVSFVDIEGRNVGFDYAYISQLITKRFPASRASVRVLQDWYQPIMQQNGQRLPVRRRSRKLLARGYTRSLLMHQDRNGIGYSYLAIQRRVVARFPDIKRPSRQSLASTEAALRHRVKFPPRPPFAHA